MNVKTILKTGLAAALTALPPAVSAAGTEAAAQLAGIVSVAPYADVSAKVTSFGLLIGNPVVPALLLASVQSSAVSTYGRFRSDAPMYLVSYAVAAGRNDEVVIYPSVDRIARMALANPGSERTGADELHLQPSERHPQDRYAVFTPDGLFVAFAATPALARRALADCRPDVKASLPLLRAALRRPGVKAVCRAGANGGATNLVSIIQGFARLDVSLDLDPRGLALAFSGVRLAPDADAGLKQRLTQTLKETWSGMGGRDNAAMAPSVTVETAPGGVVTGEVRLSEEQLKGLGKDFNAFVATQMSGALSGDKPGNKDKKGANGKDGTK